MKQIFTLIALLCSLYAQAQADLTLGDITIPTSNLTRGYNYTFTFNIKNTGTEASASSHTSFYLSTSTSLAGAVKIADVSTQPLQPGQETGEVTFVHPVPYNVPTGSNYLFIYVDSRNEVPELNENDKLWYNGQKVGFLSVICFKWTKSRLIIFG